jgi:hypothetical protein
VNNPVAAPSSTAYYGPRFDYDPVTLQPRGLLIEEQRSNTCFQSEDFSTTWTVVGLTVQTNTIVSPAGTLTADLLREDTATSDHRTQQPNVSFASGTNTFSGYVKAGGRSVVKLQVDGSVGGSPSSASVDVNLSTGVAAPPTSSANISSPSSIVTNVGNGWYRISLTFAATVSFFGTPRFFVLQSVGGSSSYTGNGTSGLFIWGAQLEAGAFPTSYIPTTTAQVTRSADVAVIQGSNFSSWYNQNEGTMFVNASTLFVPASGQNSVFRINSNVETNELRIRYVDGQLRGQIHNASGETFSSGSSALASVLYKSSLAYRTNDSAFTINGAAATTDTSVSLPTDVIQACLGSRSTAGAASLNGHIRQIAYYPTRLQNSQLQAITS